MKQTNRNKPAFTLIELLVVIAIIGLLSTISIVALNQARSKARDARRVADMHQLVTAINMYYNVHGVYPPLVEGQTSGVESSSNNTFMHNLVTEDFLSSDLKDPRNDIWAFYYYWMDNTYTGFTWFCPNAGAKFSLFFALENNTTLPGFATACSNQSADTGYRRCICFY